MYLIPYAIWEALYLEFPSHFYDDSSNNVIGHSGRYVYCKGKLLICPGLICSPYCQGS